MDLAAGLFAELANSVATRPLLENDDYTVRVYPLMVPQRYQDKTQLGCIVYSLSAVDRGVSYCGTDKIVRTAMNVDCYAGTYAKARELAAAVREALTDFRGMLGGLVETRTANITGELDLLDIEPGLFRVSQTWDFWHIEP